jgi:hypothetical protein
MNIPLDKDGKVDYPKIMSDIWGILFHRPDPLGFCIIQMDMYNVMRIGKMSVIERQIEKGYMKK